MLEPVCDSIDSALPALSTVVDPRIPTLAAVVDGVELGRQLAPLCLSRWQWGALQHIRVRVLRWYRGKRCTFEIALRTESGGRSLIGKVYAAHRPDVNQVMEEIRRAGFGTESECSIPEPLAYLPSLHLRLEEHVPGVSAEEVFLKGDFDEQAAAAERCAQWLARFHALAPRLGKATEVSGQLLRIRRWNSALAGLGKPLATKSELLLQKLGAASAAPGVTRFCAGHGSYLPEHVIFTRGRTVTIDWDEYDVGDPSRNAAWFVVSLERLALKNSGSRHALDGAAQAFLRKYVSSGFGEVMAWLPFWKATYYLRSAKHQVTDQPPGWREMAEALLDEALRA